MWYGGGLPPLALPVRQVAVSRDARTFSRRRRVRRDMRLSLPGLPVICSEHFMRGLIFMRSRCILFHLSRMKRRLGKDVRGRIASAVCSGFCIQIHFQRDCL